MDTTESLEAKLRRVMGDAAKVGAWSPMKEGQRPLPIVGQSHDALRKVADILEGERDSTVRALDQARAALARIRHGGGR